MQELEVYLKDKEIHELIEEYDEEELKEDKDYNENKLSKKQSEKIKVNGIQKADLNKKVDGKETFIEEIRTTTNNTESFEYNVLDENEKYAIAEKTLDEIKALIKTKRSNSNICLKEE